MSLKIETNHFLNQNVETFDYEDLDARIKLIVVSIESISTSSELLD